MTHEEVMKIVTGIFRDVFDDDALVIEDSTNSSDIEDWDSLEHIALIVSMEKEFNLKFDLQEDTQPTRTEFGDTPGGEDEQRRPGKVGTKTGLAE